jgi:hypothetical protein
VKGEGRFRQPFVFVALGKELPKGITKRKRAEFGILPLSHVFAG